MTPIFKLLPFLFKSDAPSIDLTIMFAVLGVLFAFWLVHHCEKPRKDKTEINGFMLSENPSEAEFAAYTKHNRVEYFVEEALKLTGSERDEYLLRLPGDERFRVKSEILLRDYESSWQPLSNNLRKADACDYQVWIDGFIKKGGQPTHHYNYDLPEDFFLATADFNLPEWYGAQAISLIVPEYINVDYDNLGHNNIFWLKDYSASGHGWVPTYRNIKTR